MNHCNPTVFNLRNMAPLTFEINKIISQGGGGVIVPAGTLVVS